MSEEFYFAEIIGSNGKEVIVPDNTDRESINKLCEDFNMLDENVDALIFHIPLDEHLRRRKLICQISRYAREDIVHGCIFTVLTLCSARKHTIRIECDRN